MDTFRRAPFAPREDTPVLLRFQPMVGPVSLEAEFRPGAPYEAKTTFLVSCRFPLPVLKWNGPPLWCSHAIPTMTVQRRAKKHTFVVTPYRTGPDGTFEPELPTEGVCAGQDRRPCKLNVNHRRERSTGPCFALTVMRCRPHRRGFTLYPPGHVPYGRIGVAAVAPDGSPIHGSDGAERYRGTLFEASVDAAEQKAWHREHRGAPPIGGGARS